MKQNSYLLRYSGISVKHYKPNFTNSQNPSLSFFFLEKRKANRGLVVINLTRAAMATSSSEPPQQSQEPPPQQQQPQSVKDCLHKTKLIQFLGRTAPIVLQNDNGPCPLLAICKFLSLSLLGFRFLIS